MRLDAYILVIDEAHINEQGYILEFTERQEVAYWRNNWWLQKYMHQQYEETVNPYDPEFNCKALQLSEDLLMDCLNQMSKELYKQSISFGTPEDILETSDVDELKIAIYYLRDNPKNTIYYYGRY